MLSKSFKAGKCKTSLKLAIARIKLLKNKREVQVKQMKRDLAQLLEAGQDQTARIRVEHVIREEKTMSAYDLIELYSELIVARLAIIESQKNCPIDLKEAISSVIFASPRCADIPELMDVRKHFVAKYGKEFVTSAVELRPDCGVNRLIVEKLSAKAPDIETKIKVLTSIAVEHSIKWDHRAFEEEVRKPAEDLLNGPTTFTNKMPVESSTIQFPPSPGEKHKSATKPTEKGMDRPPFSSNSFSPPKSEESISHAGSRAAESTYEVGESGHTYFTEEVASSQRRWTMEFRDATSAAQAAAESAERASMAARAAAELASRGSDLQYSYRSHEPSTYGSKHEAGNLMGSKLQGESLTRDPIKRDHSIDDATYAMKQRMQSGLEAERMQDHVARDSKKVNEASETTRSQYSRIISSPSIGSSSEKDVIEANRRQKKSGKDDSPSEKSAERHPISPASSYSSRCSHDGDVSIPYLQKSESHTPESFFKAGSVNQNLSERTDHADAGQGGIQRKSSKPSSSHSSVSSIDHEMILDSPVHKNYGDQRSMFAAGQEVDQSSHKHGFSDAAPVVFDRSDSENDSEIDNVFEKGGFVSTLQHSEASFYTSSSNVGYPASDRQNSGFNLKDGSSSSFHSVSKLQPEEISGMARGENPPSVIFDVSDPDSSEDEMDEPTDRGDTVLNSLHSNRSAGMYERPQSLSRSSVKDMEKMDKNDQFSLSSTDADTESQLSYVGENELNFGRLTGGLRNKGFIRPPYVKNRVVDDSLPSENLTDGSSKKPMSSPEDNTDRFEDVIKNVNSRKPHFKTNEKSRSRSQKSISSDTVEVKDLEQHLDMGSSEYSSVTSLLSTSKLYENLPNDDEQKVSSKFIEPETNETNWEKSHQRSTWRTSKESNCTSPAAYIDKDAEKQPLSHAGRNHSSGVTYSVLANQNYEDTETSISNTRKISGHADMYSKKSSVKTSKGSVSTPTPFFDEENDEDEVLQPRHAVGNSGIRSGRRLSWRTKGSKAEQLSDFSGSPHGSSHNLKTPDLKETKSVESTSSMSETPLKPSTTGIKPEKDRTSTFLPPNLSSEQHPSLLSETEVLVQNDGLSSRSVPEAPLKPSAGSVKPEKDRTSKFLPPNLSAQQQHPAVLSEDNVLAEKDGLEPSQRSLLHNKPSQSVSAQTGVQGANESVKPSTMAGGSTSRENSLKGSHVHPKLPDYDSLAGYFKTLRSNRR